MLLRSARCAGAAAVGLMAGAVHSRAATKPEVAPEVAPPVAFVTGAGGTLGAAAVRVLVEEGYRVVAADLVSTQPLCDEINAHYGDECVVPATLDVSDEAQVREVAATVQREVGTVSVLVNNAGILSRNKTCETNAEEWDRVMSINVKGYFLLAREFLPGMRQQGWGRIINTGSMAAKTGGITAGTAYSVSKGAVHSLTLSLARETAHQGSAARETPHHAEPRPHFPRARVHLYT